MWYVPIITVSQELLNCRIIYQSRASNSERGFGSTEQQTYVGCLSWSQKWLDQSLWNFQGFMREGGRLSSAKKKFDLITFDKNSFFKQIWNFEILCLQPNPIWSSHLRWPARLWGRVALRHIYLILIHTHQTWQHWIKFELLNQLRKLFAEALIVTEEIYDELESHNSPRTFDTNFIYRLV